MVDSDWSSENSFNKSKGSVSPPQYPHEYMVKTLSNSNSGLRPLEFDAEPESLRLAHLAAIICGFSLTKDSEMYSELKLRISCKNVQEKCI